MEGTRVATKVELEGVTKRFGDQTVVQDLTFSVGSGEILGLLGPNGAGKTTTLRLLGGVIAPDAGRIHVAGFDPVRDGEAVRARIGILTESAGFYPHLSGLENLRFFARLYGVAEPQRPQHLLGAFGLRAAGDRKVGTYSTGMKKRLGLAKALLHRPEVLFLDEPTAGLDPEGIQMVLAGIRDLNRQEGTTAILCSHVLHQIETVCHRYVVLDQGEVLAQGTLPELADRWSAGVELLVETDLQWDGEAYQGYPARRVGPDQVAFRLPDRAAVPGLLRQVAATAAVYGATLAGRDLESVYFTIRRRAREEGNGCG